VIKSEKECFDYSVSGKENAIASLFDGTALVIDAIGAPSNTHRYFPFPFYDEQDCLLSFVYELEGYP
jgi:hypothetical protein